MAENRTIDRDALVDVLDSHPISLAVLFGSVVGGQTHPNSDVDIAVEFEDAVDDEGDALVSLMVDITSALHRDDIDLEVLNDLDPRIGRSAVEGGVVLVGGSRSPRRPS